MRVLIVEDNAFNAYCLRRLLESASSSIAVTIVSNSQAALSLIYTNMPDLVVIDGDLNAVGDSQCNGPELADILLQKFPHLPLIAWSDSEPMLHAFAQSFKSHGRPFNEYNSWLKMISAERILKTWIYHFGAFFGDQTASLSYYSKASAC